MQTNQPERAIEAFHRAILLDARNAAAHHDQGSAHYRLRNYAAAVDSYTLAIDVDAQCTSAYYNRGNALFELQRFAAAVESFDQAIASAPAHANAYHNRGVALRDLARYEAAVASFDATIALEPGHTHAHYHRGNALHDLGENAAAVASYERTLALDPNYAAAYIDRVEALMALDRPEAAIAGIDAALALSPEHPGLYGQRQLLRMRICDWYDYDIEVAGLTARILGGETASSPYHLLLLSDSAALQLQCAQQWVRRKCPPDPALGAILKRAPHERIRIGYFSADFRAHPVSILSAELFETHDRAFFEVSAFAFGPESVDPMRTRLERAFERFIDVRGQSDREIALLARSLEIDIAVDLGGFTKGCRPGIFALRAAPLQVGYLGYPGTSGAGYMDYLIADPTIIPERCRPYYSEQILYLPDSCLPGDSQRPIGAEALTRAQAGLPATGCVFCCFNNIAKITPDTFSGWMRILAQVPDSVLWLSQTNRQAESNLRREAASRGVEPHRLLFAPRLPSLPQHLARQRLADLFLDTLPYNAHTTASDALWAGLPVLTLAGESFAGRVAASLLNAVGLPELITASAAQFEALAVALASDPPRLADIRRRLAAHRLSTPLFDTPRYARHLETAYAMIHARHQADLAPEHMAVVRRTGPEHAAQMSGHAIRPRGASGANAGDATNAAAHFERGNTEFQQARYEAAVASYTEVIAVDPKHSFAHFNRGNAELQLGRFEAAITSYDAAIAINPQHAEAHFNRGNALFALGRFAPAAASHAKAIAIKPGFTAAHNNRGSALFRLQQFEAAIASFDAAISIEPADSAAYGNRANALIELERYAAALAGCDAAIALTADSAEFHHLRGNALRKLKDLAAAVASYETAIAIDPSLADAHRNRGVAQLELRHYEAAVASFDAAIALDPHDVRAHVYRGEALTDLGRLAAAIESFDAAIALQPDYVGLYGQRAHLRMRICDWRGFETILAEITAGIGRGEAVASPFTLLGLLGSAALQKRAAETWVKAVVPLNPSAPATPRRTQSAKIRIGYFSADYQEHATLFLMAELFEMHDRSKFQVIAFSFGPVSTNPMRLRLDAACEVIDVRARSDRDVAQLAREREIDIAVDLKGFTRGSRAAIFAWRAAPVQVNYLGYPGTMGAPYVDYLIADRTLIPPGNEDYYTEKIVFMPDSYQVNDAKRAIAIRDFTRSELGLPAAGFVFCCFNNTFKLTPDTFSGWMRILRRVDLAVLWLFEDNPQASDNLRRAAERSGVRPERLIFAPRMRLPEHLARHRAADLFVDTVPCNAHTTASDALWAGLPVLTLAGEAFAGRVAASLLNAVGLSELVASTQAEYEELAVELAADPKRLASLRRALAERRLTAPLFDTPLYTKHLEAAYSSMHARYHAGLPPDHLWVAATGRERTRGP
jgi:predicted O-linked N-acetylglucosamine transferase (SPINDLY family)